MNNSSVNLISPVPPLMTIENFAESVGVTPSVVDGWIKREYIPSKKMGKRRLVNMVQLTVSLIADQDDSNSGVPLDILKKIGKGQTKASSKNKPKKSGANKTIDIHLSVDKKIPRIVYDSLDSTDRHTVDLRIKKGKCRIDERADRSANYKYYSI